MTHVMRYGRKFNVGMVIGGLAMVWESPDPSSNKAAFGSVSNVHKLIDDLIDAKRKDASRAFGWARGCADSVAP